MGKAPKGSVTRRQLVGIIVLIAVTATIVLTMTLCRRQSVQVSVTGAPVEIVPGDTVRHDSAVTKERMRQRLRRKIEKKSGRQVKPAMRQPRPRNYDVEPDKE